MSNKHDNAIGQRFADADPELFAELLGYLRAGNISPAFYVPNENEIALICERLANVRVRHRCGCGQPDCRTYYLEYPQKAYDAGSRTIRLFARGEAMMHLDREGDIFEIERLCDDSSDPMTIHARSVDGTWVAKTV